MKHCAYMFTAEDPPCHFVKKYARVDYSWPIMQRSCRVLFVFVFTLLFLIRGVPNGESAFSRDAMLLDIQQLKL